MDTSHNQDYVEYTYWEKTLLFFSGAETDVVDSQVFSEFDEDKLKNVGLAVLVGTFVAFVNAYILGQILVQGSGSSIWYAIAFAFFWAGLVFWNDRALFRTFEVKSLIWRILFLLVSCLGISTGFQLWRADNKIVNKINFDAGCRNDSLNAQLQAVRDKYDPTITDLNEEISRIWADSNVIYKTRRSEPLKRQVKQHETARDSALAQKQRAINLLTVVPDYSFNNKLEIFSEHFAFKNPFDLFVALILILLEGWALWLRFANWNMDYLKYVEVKKGLPKRIILGMSIDDKIQLYLKCQKQNRDSNQNPKNQSNPNRGSDDLFKSFDINDIEIPS